MELRQLRYFLAVAEQGNFSKAADAVGVTQQALSYSVAQLEKQLQTQLFARTQSGVELTDIGHVFAKRARMIVAETDLAHREVEILRDGQRGSVRFGVGSTIVQHVLPRIVQRFARARPKFSLTLKVDLSRPLYDRLLSGEIEVALTAPAAVPIEYGQAELQHEIIEGQEFDANFLVMRVGHPLLSLRTPTLQDVVRYPWIVPETMTDFVRTLFDLFAAQNVRAPDYVMRTDSFWGANALVLETDFVVWIGRHIFKSEIEAGLLAGFPLPGVQARRQIVLSHRMRSPLQPAAAALVQVFREVLQSSD
jgi:LysR family transcriptional regulator of gallate degradation